MRARLGRVLLLGLLVAVVAAPAAVAALTVTRAELSGDRLRIEGEGAAPNAVIQVEGIDMGVSGADGRFRIERSGFSSPTCRVIVSDFRESVEVTLTGCTALQIQIGREVYVPEQQFLSEDESVTVAAEFRRWHPWRSRLLAAILGWGDLSSEAAVRDFVRRRPFVSFRPGHTAPW